MIVFRNNIIQQKNKILAWFKIWSNFKRNTKTCVMKRLNYSKY